MGKQYSGEDPKDFGVPQGMDRGRNKLPVQKPTSRRQKIWEFSAKELPPPKKKRGLLGRKKKK